MSAIPGDLSTDRQPPMTVPLRHFLVAVGLLVFAIATGAAHTSGVALGRLRLAHVHLFFVGFVCVTIMGAMTQFVPVWSGVSLHDRRLATAQLWLVAAGVLGLVVGLLGGPPRLLLVGPVLLLVGFWTFAYNIARTLWLVEEYDVTERHFAYALGFVLLATGLGASLAVGLVEPMYGATRPAVVGAHATLAVFGIVLTTVFGALYQLATMFTQTALHGVDVHLRRLEETASPLGVVVLALGRLLGVAVVARVGGLLVLAGTLSVSVVLARRLWETHLEWTPMLRRYAVVAIALAAWSLATLPAWVRSPLGRTRLFGGPAAEPLLLFGVVGFVVFGTLYHVVPFVVWVHRYSDRLGLADVPMIDDLYDHRVAAADLACLLVGWVLVVASRAFDVTDHVAVAGAGLLLVGSALFAGNVANVVRVHGPHSLARVLVGAAWPGDVRTSAGTGDD